MKAKKQSAGLKHLPKAGCSFIPATPTKSTLKALSQHNGKNDHAAQIEHVLNAALPLFDSLTLSHAIQLTRDIEGAEISEVTEIFQRWAEILCKEGRLLKSPLFNQSYFQPRYENKRNASETV